MNKVVFFAFQGEKMCFLHLLFNAIDMHKKGIEAKIVIEGKATALVKPMVEEKNPLFMQAIDLQLIDSVCKACSNQMGVLDFIQNNTNLPLNDDLMGHPPMEPYIAQGCQLITL